MKKKLLILGAVVLALALLLGGAYLYARSAKPFHTGDLTGYAVDYPYEGREIQPMHIRDTGEFVILKFTDMHFTTGKGLRDSKILASMEAALEQARPDLAVITGDVLEGWNSLLFYDARGALDALAEVFEGRKQPWAYMPGNHDNEGYLGTAEDFAAYLAANYAYCILSNEPGLTGATQYAIPLLDAGGGTAHKLLFMDSLSYEEVENGEWWQESMKPDQVGWLAAQLMVLKEEAPAARASVFFHFETPALAEATEPDNWNVWSPAGNAAIDDVMRRAGNVGLLSTGHWHQTHCAFQDGMYYHVTRNPGASVITICPTNENPQNMYRIEEIEC